MVISNGEKWESILDGNQQHLVAIISRDANTGVSQDFTGLVAQKKSALRMRNHSAFFILPSAFAHAH
jgi:hypothetical protein